MTIELTENTLGIWAVSISDECDWLGAVWREGDDYVLEYRFRYYVDDKTFDSKDRKNWYRTVITGGQPEDKVVGVMREMARMLWSESGGKRYELMMDGGGIVRMMEDLAKWPMISMQTVKHDDGDDS